MGNFSNILKKILLLLIFITLWFPIIQNKLSLFELEPLKGDNAIPAEVNLNESSWWTADYQKEQENYLNSMFGLRNFCVRLNNQIAYNIFNKAHAKDVVIGKEGYLFELNYIKAYNGSDCVGKDSINNVLNRLNFINDTLLKLKKNLIVVLAPGKANYYPEYIPDEYLKNKSITNYQLFTEGAIKRDLNLIDFNKWFVENKNKSKYTLYPKHGIHWSIYGALLSSDSLIKNIETHRNISMTHFNYKTFNLEPAHGDDYDIGGGMNLLSELKSENLAYPNMEKMDSAGKTKPKVLVISDSFYWVMYGLGIANCFDANHHVCYYNKQVYPESFTNEKLVSNLNFKEEINKYDVIIILATDNNLRNIGWGFAENFERALKFNSNTNHKSERQIKIENLISYIKNDKQWVKDTKSRASEKNITLDSALVLEAMWQIDHEKK